MSLQGRDLPASRLFPKPSQDPCGSMNRLNCAAGALQSGDHEPRGISKERPFRNYWEIATLATLRLLCPSVPRLENLVCRNQHKCPSQQLFDQLSVLWDDFCLILNAFRLLAQSRPVPPWSRCQPRRPPSARVDPGSSPSVGVVN